MISDEVKGKAKIFRMAFCIGALPDTKLLYWQKAAQN